MKEIIFNVLKFVNFILIACVFLYVIGIVGFYAYAGKLFINYPLAIADIITILVIMYNFMMSRHVWNIISLEDKYYHLVNAIEIYGEIENYNGLMKLVENEKNTPLYDKVWMANSDSSQRLHKFHETGDSKYLKDDHRNNHDNRWG